MSAIAFFLQALPAGGHGVAPQPGDVHGLMSELLPVLAVGGVILAVGALLFLAVYYIKRGRASDVSNDGPGHHHHRRHRKRRQSHRPRNPTLAETGGLPPLRSDDETRPSQP